MESYFYFIICCNKYQNIPESITLFTKYTALYLISYEIITKKVLAYQFPIDVSEKPGLHG